MLTRVHVITAYGQSKSLLNKTITLLNQFAAKCRRSRAPSGPYSEIESIKSALYRDMRHPPLPLERNDLHAWTNNERYDLIMALEKESSLTLGPICKPSTEFAAAAKIRSFGADPRQDFWLEMLLLLWLPRHRNLHPSKGGTQRRFEFFKGGKGFTGEGS